MEIVTSNWPFVLSEVERRRRTTIHEWIGQFNGEIKIHIFPDEKNHNSLVFVGFILCNANDWYWPTLTFSRTTHQNCSADHWQSFRIGVAIHMHSHKSSMNCVFLNRVCCLWIWHSSEFSTNFWLKFLFACVWPRTNICGSINRWGSTSYAFSTESSRIKSELIVLWLHSKLIQTTVITSPVFIRIRIIK